MESRPWCTYGVVTDIQYADIDNRQNYTKTELRYYRDSAKLAEKAFQFFEDCKSEIQGVLQLGDLIDLANSKHEREDPQSREALETILQAIKPYTGKIYHLIGNHELYNFGHDELRSRLGIPTTAGPDCCYYSLQPHPRVRIMVLDSFDLSVWGYDPEHPRRQAALKILEEHNPSENKNIPSSVDGKEHFVMFNGAVGERQRKWMEQELEESLKLGQVVVVASHVPVLPVSGPSAKAGLQWDKLELLEILHKYPNIVALLSGHTHAGGHQVDEFDVHHHVFEAVLTTPPGTDCFGLLDVYPDRLVIRGRGRLSSLTMPYRKSSIEFLKGFSSSSSSSLSSTDSTAPAPAPAEAAATAASTQKESAENKEQ